MIKGNKLADTPSAIPMFVAVSAGRISSLKAIVFFKSIAFRAGVSFGQLFGYP
jgi:hypothetical protein